MKCMKCNGIGVIKYKAGACTNVWSERCCTVCNGTGISPDPNKPYAYKGSDYCPECGQRQIQPCLPSCKTNKNIKNNEVRKFSKYEDSRLPSVMRTLGLSGEQAEQYLDRCDEYARGPGKYDQDGGIK